MKEKPKVIKRDERKEKQPAVRSCRQRLMDKRRDLIRQVREIERELQTA